MADAADSLIGGDLHGAFGHVQRRPELELIAVGIGEVDDRAFFALGSCFYRVGVHDLVLVEPLKVHVDVFQPDVKAAARQILAQLFGGRVDIRLKKSADAARAAVPPHEAEDRGIFLSVIRGETIDRSDRQSRSVQRPVSPARQVVSADDVMIDPMYCSFGFDVGHDLILREIKLHVDNRNYNPNKSNRPYAWSPSSAYR